MGGKPAETSGSGSNAMFGANISRRRAVIFAFLHALFLMAYTWYWLSLPKTHGDEAWLIRWSSVVKRSLLGIDEKPPVSDFLFIDVNKYQQLIPAPDALFGETEAVTDRESLVRLFRMINRRNNAVTFVLCDVLFDLPSGADGALESEMKRLGDRFLTISHWDRAKNRLIRPVMDVPAGLATYLPAGGGFFKYPLALPGKPRSVPLIMYETLHGATHWAGPFGLFFMDGTPAMGMPIIEFRVRPIDLKPAVAFGETNYEMYGLGEFVALYGDATDAEMSALFDDRIVIIGDLTGSSDRHTTTFGSMPGSLIMLNTYLTLVHGENVVSPAWLVFMIACYWGISYHMFAGIRVRRPARFIRWLTETKSGKFFYKYLNYPMYLTLMTLVSYYLFHIHINILYIAVYINAVFINYRKYRNGGYNRYIEFWNRRFPKHALRLQGDAASGAAETSIHSK